MRAAILSIGDELTLGQALDTNSQWLSRELLARGIVPVEHATVPDDQGAIADALPRLARGDGTDSGSRQLIVCTGGLGPTADDLTRHALARALGEELIEDEQARVQIESWFAGRGRPMPAINRVQALRPRSARSLANAHGTAPGLAARLSSPPADIFCLPGPPREMVPMFEAHVAPALRPPDDRLVITRTLMTFGLGESDIGQRLGCLMHRDRKPLVGTTASGGHVACRVRFESRSGESSRSDAERAIAATIDRVRDALGPFLISEAGETIQSIAVRLLRDRGESLSVAESCTGGMLGTLLTEVPGSSAAFEGGFITYSNAQKAELLGVPKALFAPGGPGAVSLECARAMALGCLERTRTHHAIGITGIAGPDGGTPGKPVGTVWIALASREPRSTALDVRRFLLGPDRASVREWSARLALAMLRFRILGIEEQALIREQERHQSRA